MTRFARAAGSKASNKREPEDATPWSSMVKQIKSVEDVGVEDDVEYGDGGEQMEVDEDEILKKDSDEEEDEIDDEDLDVSPLDEEDDIKGLNLEGNTAPKREVPSELVSVDEPKKKKRKKSEKCKVCGDKGHRKMDCEKLPEERRKELQELFAMKVGRAGKGTGRKKNKKKQNSDCLAFEEKENAIVDKDIVPANDKENKGGLLHSTSHKEHSKGHYSSKTEVKDRSGAVVEKGEVLFQGFRVKKEDQKRLLTLVKQLKAEGLSKKELDATMKKERRIAEKNLSRSKKLVCFNCREPGHMLAECPSAKAEENNVAHQASGHCFKCGSLEHTSRDCKSKLKRENAYRFAVCFICKEEGHLAKACPDNPKGLYPKGGGCVFCGSVEHLKRDCERKVQKDLKQGVRVDTIGSDRGLEDEPVFESAGQVKKKMKMMKIKEKKTKIVAF